MIPIVPMDKFVVKESASVPDFFPNQRSDGTIHPFAGQRFYSLKGDTITISPNTLIWLKKEGRK